MRKFLALLVLGLVALAAGAAFAFADGGAVNGPAQDLIYGGGRIPAGSCTDGSTAFCTGLTREFSIHAVSSPEGAGAHGTVTFGKVENGGPRTSFARASRSTATLAEIGGVVDSADSSAVGGSFRLFVRDSGKPGTVARDGVSPYFVDAPPTKPTCGDLSTGAFGYGHLALGDGDLVVQNG